MSVEAPRTIVEQANAVVGRKILLEMVHGIACGCPHCKSGAERAASWYATSIEASSTQPTPSIAAKMILFERAEQYLKEKKVRKLPQPLQ